MLDLLERAREARVNLPAGAPSPRTSAEIRVPVPDRPGVLAEVTTLLGEMAVNIYDLEIAHSAEGDRGVLVLVVDAGSHRPSARTPCRTAASAARCDRSGHEPRSPPCRPAGRAATAGSGCPGDKSISHRALLLAARAEGRSRLTGLSNGDDVAHTLRAVGGFGAGVDADGRGGGRRRRRCRPPARARRRRSTSATRGPASGSWPGGPPPSTG